MKYSYCQGAATLVCANVVSANSFSALVSALPSPACSSLAVPFTRVALVLAHCRALFRSCNCSHVPFLFFVFSLPCLVPSRFGPSATVPPPSTQSECPPGSWGISTDTAYLASLRSCAQSLSVLRCTQCGSKHAPWMRFD